MHARNLHSDLQSSSTNRAAGPCCASFFQDAHGLRNLPLSWLLPVHLPMVARGTDACVESQEVNLCLWPEADRPICCDTDDCGLLQFFPQPDELLICFNSAGFSEFQLPGTSGTRTPGTYFGLLESLGRAAQEFEGLRAGGTQDLVGSALGSDLGFRVYGVG